MALPRPSLRALAVWRRNLLVWRRLAIPSLVGNFGDPLLYLLAIGWGLGRFIGEIEGVSYLSFFASGLVCASAMNAATFEALYSAYTRMAIQGTWNGMLAAPLVVDDIVFGETLWAATKSLINATIILVVALFLGAVEGWGIFAAIPVVFLTGLCFGSMALVVTAISPSYDFFLYYFTLVITPMFLFCGVFFPVQSLPDGVRWVTDVLPLTHSVGLLRPLLTDLPGTGAPLLSLAVLATYATIALVLSTFLVRRRLLS